MGNGVGKKDHQIGRTDLVSEVAGHLGEYFGLAAITLTDLFVLEFHTFIATNDYNAHGKTSLSLYLHSVM